MQCRKVFSTEDSYSIIAGYEQAKDDVWVQLQKRNWISPDEWAKLSGMLITAIDLTCDKCVMRFKCAHEASRHVDKSQHHTFSLKDGTSLSIG